MEAPAKARPQIVTDSSGAADVGSTSMIGMDCALALEVLVKGQISRGALPGLLLPGQWQP